MTNEAFLTFTLGNLINLLATSVGFIALIWKFGRWSAVIDLKVNAMWEAFTGKHALRRNDD